jgi:hypothetical protein|tara:strand:- start:44 stop:208 length:165 start_codon:yes stop_codon:yes gene_type:complete
MKANADVTITHQMVILEYQALAAITHIVVAAAMAVKVTQDVWEWFALVGNVANG